MYHFIVNPKASSGKGLKIWTRVAGQLTSEQVSYKIYFTEKCGHAAQLARQISAEATKAHPRVIVAVGGDGTANEVVDGLQNYEFIRFGYIPAGSGNDMARGLHLYREPLKALHAILHPTDVKSIRIGCTTCAGQKHRFIVGSGAGFDAAVCHEVEHSPAKPFLNRIGLGKLTYLGVALRQLISMHPAGVTVTLDEKKQIHFDSILFAAAMNLPYEGGGFMFCPDADATDAFLDICVVERISRLKILYLLPTAFRGKHIRYGCVHIYRCQTIDIAADAPLAIHTDGEPHGYHTDFHAELLAQPLSFITH